MSKRHTEKVKRLQQLQKGKQFPGDDMWYDPGPTYTVYDDKAGKFFGDEQFTDGYQITVKPFTDWALRHKKKKNNDGKNGKGDDDKNGKDHEWDNCTCQGGYPYPYPYPSPYPSAQDYVEVHVRAPCGGPRWTWCPVHGEVPAGAPPPTWGHGPFYPPPPSPAPHRRHHRHHPRGCRPLTPGSYEYQDRRMCFSSPHVGFHSPIVSRYH